MDGATTADEREIHRLLHRYCELQDAADFTGVSALFAHAHYRVEGGPAVFGADAVRALKTAHDHTHEDGTLRTAHVTTNTIVDIDADHLPPLARTRSYFTVFQATTSLALQPVVAGSYLDTFEKVDGAWRFADRLIVAALVGDLSQHLRDNPLEATRAGRGQEGR